MGIAIGDPLSLRPRHQSLGLQVDIVIYTYIYVNVLCKSIFIYTYIYIHTYISYIEYVCVCI